jgi:aryl-alcohol dehydrogenase-like predicted oxidoreductase
LGALGWLIWHSHWTGVSHLDENVAAAALELTPEEFTAIDVVK